MSMTTDAPRPRSLKTSGKILIRGQKSEVHGLTKTLRLSVFKQTNQENFARISEEGTRERS